MSHLRHKHGAYYARLQVPPDVRATFGGKREVWKHLNTKDRRAALLRVPIVVEEFRQQVLSARNGVGSADYGEALAWLRKFKTAKTAQEAGDEHALSDTHDVFLDYVEGRFTRGVPWQDFDDRREGIETIGGPVATRFIKVATGETLPLRPLVDEWHKTYRGSVEDKTADMARSDVLKFVEEFPFAEVVTRKAATEWVQRRIESGDKGSTVSRKLTPIRRFWKYLQDHEHVSDEFDPFAKLEVARRSKGSGKANRTNSYVPFTDKDVVRLWTAAKANKDKALGDLILLAAFTGARIEELCSLQRDDAADGVFRVREAKTEAGRRTVPIHSALKPVVARLKKGSGDGYLLSGLKPNKYGDRSARIGKRFGSLKSSLGFTETHVFHSIRKTVTTQLERAEIPENVTADIVGHEKPRITYGTYSGGTSVQQRRAAIEKVKYPRLKPS